MFDSLRCTLLFVAIAGVIMSSSDNGMKYRALEMSKYVNFTATQTLVMVLCASKSSQHHFLEDQLILLNFLTEN